MFTSFSRMSRSFRMRDLALLAIASLMMALPAYPQQSSASQAASGQSDNAALQQKIRDLEDRLIALEGQVRLLKSQAAPAPSPATAPATPTEAAAQAAPVSPTPAAPLSQAQAISLGGAGGSAAKALNPDISAIGDFIAVAGHNPVQPSPSLEMHESELGFQAIIDPYARGDFFLSFGEEGVNLEEGYITFTALPAGFVARVGKMRSAFGKVNTMHNHVLPWVDRPLVTNSLVGGEDGIDDAGVSIQRIIPAPKGIFLEATGQVFRGDSGDGLQSVFKSWQRSDISTVAHLRSYKDISESTNVDIGLSYARGYNDSGPNFLTNLYGVDATVRWKPLRRSIYHSF